MSDQGQEPWREMGEDTQEQKKDEWHELADGAQEEEKVEQMADDAQEQEQEPADKVAEDAQEQDKDEWHELGDDAPEQEQKEGEQMAGDAKEQEEAPAGDVADDTPEQEQQEGEQMADDAQEQEQEPAGEVAEDAHEQEQEPAGEVAEDAHEQEQEPAGEVAEDAQEQEQEPAGEVAEDAQEQDKGEWHELGDDAPEQEQQEGEQMADDAQEQEQVPAGDGADDNKEQEQEQLQSHLPEESQEDPYEGDQKQNQDLTAQENRGEPDELQGHEDASPATGLAPCDEYEEHDAIHYHKETAPEHDGEQTREGVSPLPAQEYPQEPNQQDTENPPSEYPQEGEQKHKNVDSEHEKTDFPREPSKEDAEEGTPPHIQKVHHAFKPRNTPRKQPIRWEPIEYDLSEDSEDEFDLRTAMQPIYVGEGKEVPKDQPIFKNGEPDYDGEFLSCFDESNLLYRIFNREEKTWAFYNDSRSYEMHVQFIFGKRSKVEPLENTTMYTRGSGEQVLVVIVYPGETEMFIKGSVNGFTSKLRAIPLSEEYYQCRQALSESIVEEEVQQVRRIAGEKTDAEEVLKLCVEHNIPFVDLEFLPCQTNLDTGAKKPFKKLAWFRPSMYLPQEMHDQVRLFRGRIRPADVVPGELGDSWVMCSIAAISEHPQKLMNMFRHPTDPELGKKERAVGGYRVLLNKNGLWRSVIVDDYLPTSGGKPKYAQSSHDFAELWSSILEKAFAKLHGSYAKICSGDPLHAMQDMTGYPSWRFDEAFIKTPDSEGDDLFQQWLKFAEAGYQMILTTPGKESSVTNYSSESSLFNRYKKVGLITGHAYTVLDVKYFPEHEFRLVKLRNAWGRGAEWSGDWCDNDEKWEKFPEVAEGCNFDKDDDGTLWMTFEACQNYFNGGGVSFVQLSANDYRIPSQFEKCVPSSVLEVIVEEPTWMCATISQPDKRYQNELSEYQPVMLSITSPVEGEVYKVIQNSSADASNPFADKWAFYQARDINLIYKFQPEHSPYLIVPRMLAIEKQKEAVPYVMGISCNKPIGQGGVTVNFKSIDKDNKVFHNFPKFKAETTSVEAEYQVKFVGQSFPETRTGSTMF